MRRARSRKAFSPRRRAVHEEREVAHRDARGTNGPDDSVDEVTGRSRTLAASIDSPPSCSITRSVKVPPMSTATRYGNLWSSLEVAGHSGLATDGIDDVRITRI